MNFKDIHTAIKTQWLAGGPEDIFFLQSAPGIGKSALAKELGADPELAFDHVVEINGSLLDTPDLAGLALIGEQTSEVLHFKKSPLIAPCQTGRNLIIWEEVPDATIGMQNLIARWAYDKEVNGTKLSDQTFHIMLGNRSKDKSGAGRVSTKLSNRVCVLEMEANLDAWVNWALDRGVNPIGVQFLRFKPSAFHDFNPDAPMGVNPTPRSWVRAFRTADALPEALYFQKVSGEVGSGPAAEYTAFRKIYQSLVSFDEVLANPKGTKIPTDLSAQFAIVGSLAHSCSEDNVDRVAVYVERMRSDFSVMFWLDAVRKTPAIKCTKVFVKWATSKTNVLTT